MSNEETQLKDLLTVIEPQLPLVYIDRLYETLSSMIGDNKLSTANAVIIATNLMQIVEKYTNITGQQKKALVIHVLKLFIADHLDGDDANTLLLFIDMFLPSVIDTIISIDKKELAINIRKSFKTCFPCC